MNLHRLRTGPLSVNTYILPLSKNEAIVIDPADCAFSSDEGSVLDYLSSKKLMPVAVILTHGHFDHISGLPSIKKAFPDIPVAIHKDDAAYIGENSSALQSESLSQIGFTEFLPFVSNLPGQSHFLEDKKALSDIFSDCDFSSDAGISLSRLRILHTPGHTEGSICLYDESGRVLFSGDTVFYHSWGRTDLTGGDERKIRGSLMRILDECDERSEVYSGHDGSAFILGGNF